MKEFLRKCSKCKKELKYSSYKHWWIANKNQCDCKSCSKKNKPNGRLGKLHSQQTINKIRSNNIGKHIISEETRKKLIDARRKRITSIETRIKMSGKTPWNKNKLHSENTKLKIRLSIIEDLRKKGVKFGCVGASNFNSKACQFIDRLNQEKGWNLQHALNGGEVQLYGYFVDGYDKKRNIIFEYDESLFIRYDERNNNLYEIK